jgi:hypothetical protein
MPAVLAAGRNIELQQHIYFAKISSEQRCRELHGHGRFIMKGIGGEKKAVILTWRLSRKVWTYLSKYGV